MTPEIAIVDSNTLSCLGLQNLLEEIIPTAIIRSFRSFGELMDDTPDMYVHYFISSQIYFEHTAFFLERKPKTIVLVNGETVPQLSGMPTLNIYQDEQNLAKNILQLRQYGNQYRQNHGKPAPARHSDMAINTAAGHDLSAREIEVLVLITKGLINKEIADKLIHDGYNAESLHGDLSQQQRDLTMQKFRQHLTQLLVATDVAARGLDVDDLTHVINYGLPDDIESYTHRSGRTGRAGKNGTSIAIVHTRERGKMRAIEKVIQKDFVEGKIPTAEEICKKQLYKVMDQIVKADVNEEEIEPFMADINRYFEYVDKEDIIKKIVSMEFGKFLAYYADAPEILTPSASSRGDRKERSTRKRGEGGKREPHKAEPGYQKLFINLGKTDGFYPGEIMQFLNRNIKGRQEVGHIDLLDRICYIEVPEKDATKVMRAIDGTTYKGRSVRCNDAEDTGRPAGKQSGRGSRGQAGKSSDRPTRGRKKHDENDDFGKFEKKSKRKNNKADNGGFNDNGNESDWRQFFRQDDVKLVGEEPDFSEEGWARRRPKKS